MNNLIRLLQITDCHLQQEAHSAFKGYYPDQRLDKVINDLRRQTAADDQYQHLLLTGDLAHFGAQSVYRRILDKTQDLASQCHWVPGNHDDVGLMQQFPQMQQKIIIAGKWAILLLDSTSDPDGLGSGSLSTTELKRLAAVDELPVEHVLLVLHHPPVEVGSQWQDKIKLANADQFWKVVDCLKKVRAVTFGHLHQEHHLVVSGVELFCTPATAPQYKKAQGTAILEDDSALMPPAYRVFELHENGSIDSFVKHVN